MNYKKSGLHKIILLLSLLIVSLLAACKGGSKHESGGGASKDGEPQWDLFSSEDEYNEDGPARLEESVEEYAEKRLKETGYERDFTVADKPEECVDNEGTTDLYWKITLNDGKAFYVVDDAAAGVEGTAHKYEDDLDAMILADVFSDFKNDNPTMFTTANLVARGPGVSGISFSNTVVADFESIDELKKLYDDLSEFAEYINRCEYRIEARYQFVFNHRIRRKTPISSPLFSKGDAKGSLVYNEKKNRFEFDKYSNDLEGAYKELALVCFEFGYDDILSSIPEDIVEEAKASVSERVGIKNADGKIKMYNDIIPDHSFGISYSLLYEILKREGISVSGDKYHFTYTDDGDTYEMSYDFCDYEYNYKEPGDSRKGFYYIKNGEKMPMSSYYNFHFDEKTIKNVTSLDIAIK